MTGTSKRKRSGSFGSVRMRESGRWQTRYRDREGRIHHKTFRTSGEAHGYLSKIETDMARGDWIDPRSGSVTLDEFAERWIRNKRNIRKNTLLSYESHLRNHLSPVFGRRQLQHISPADVDDWITDLTSAGRLSASSIVGSLRLLRQIMKKAVAERHIPHNPCDHVEAPRLTAGEMMFLTEQQVADLATAVGDMSNPAVGVAAHRPWRAMVALAAFSGLRWGEVTGLPIRNVDALRSRVRVTQQLHRDGRTDEPKSKASVRWVNLPQWLTDEVAAAIAMREPSPDLPEHLADLVFLTRDGNAMCASSSWRRWTWGPAVEQALPPELHGLRFHDLRHTAVAIAIESARKAGEPLNAKALQMRMGHSTITMTLDRYGHLMEGHDDAMVKAMLNPFERPTLRAV